MKTAKEWFDIYHRDVPYHLTESWIEAIQADAIEAAANEAARFLSPSNVAPVVRLALLRLKPRGNVPHTEK